MPYFFSTCEESSLQMKNAKNYRFNLLTLKATIFDTHGRNVPRQFAIFTFCWGRLSAKSCFARGLHSFLRLLIWTFN